MYGNRDASMNHVVKAWESVYGVSVVYWDEARELISDMRDGCVLPARYERRGKVEEAVELYQARKDGTLVRREIKRGKTVESEITPRDMAVAIGELTGYADELENLDA